MELVSPSLVSLYYFAYFHQSIYHNVLSFLLILPSPSLDRVLFILVNPFPISESSTSQEVLST